jgi:hypothetical protein
LSLTRNGAWALHRGYGHKLLAFHARKPAAGSVIPPPSLVFRIQEIGLSVSPIYTLLQALIDTQTLTPEDQKKLKEMAAKGFNELWDQTRLGAMILPADVVLAVNQHFSKMAR